MAGKVDAKQIPRDVLERLGIQPAGTDGGGRKRRPRSMTMDDVRGYAIRALNTMADLSQAERARVLKQATKVNDV